MAWTKHSSTAKAFRYSGKNVLVYVKQTSTAGDSRRTARKLTVVYAVRDSRRLKQSSAIVDWGKTPSMWENARFRVALVSANRQKRVLNDVTSTARNFDENGMSAFVRLIDAKFRFPPQNSFAAPRSNFRK